LREFTEKKLLYPGVQVTAVENADGELIFTLSVLSTDRLTADLF